MSGEVRRIAFTEHMRTLPKVQAFNCGHADWERQVTEWLKAPSGNNSASEDLRRGNQVWLYVNEVGDLVGVGSFGEAKKLRWPKPKSEEIPASIIPMLGVDAAHQGQGYGKHILSDLVGAAVEVAAARPLLILYVHQDSPAVGFYLKYGFIEYGKPWKDRDTGWTNKRMVLDVGQSAAVAE